MNTIYLDPALVPSSLRGSYNGKKFKAVVCETMTIPACAGLWEGGSRDVYTAIDPSNGREVRVSSDAAPWDRSRGDNKVTLSPEFLVVEHSMFQGKDLGLTFYVHPAIAAKMLPSPVELTDYEKLVLHATASYKLSYGGRDRYQMARDDNRGKLFPTRDDWERCKTSLIAKGLLNKAGAITVAGRNARA